MPEASVAFEVGDTGPDGIAKFEAAIMMALGIDSWTLVAVNTGGEAPRVETERYYESPRSNTRFVVAYDYGGGIEWCASFCKAKPHVNEIDTCLLGSLGTINEHYFPETLTLNYTDGVFTITRVSTGRNGGTASVSLDENRDERWVELDMSLVPEGRGHVAVGSAIIHQYDATPSTPVILRIPTGEITISVGHWGITYGRWNAVIGADKLGVIKKQVVLGTTETDEPTDSMHVTFTTDTAGTLTIDSGLPITFAGGESKTLSVTRGLSDAKKFVFNPNEGEAAEYDFAFVADGHQYLVYLCGEIRTGIPNETTMRVYLNADSAGYVERGGSASNPGIMLGALPLAVDITENTSFFLYPSTGAREDGIVVDCVFEAGRVEYIEVTFGGDSPFREWLDQVLPNATNLLGTWVPILLIGAVILVVGGFILRR